MTQIGSYVLVTTAYNEEKLIEATIRSVVEQDVRPLRWIIVSDGSTDETDAIVRSYSDRYAFIQLHRITEDHPRNFAAQASAINAGIARLQNVAYEFIGNVDADVTFDPGYFAAVLAKFVEDPRLGLAGGFIHEPDGAGVFRTRKTNSVTSVAHACQLFRRECFEAIGGGYLALPYGGPDTYAETTARMKGWRVEAFPEHRVLHPRPTGSAGGVLRGCFRQGKMDYSLGALPSFEIAKLARRIWVKPFVVGAAARLSGFLHSYWQREARAVPQEFMRYLRSEQRKRVAGLFHSAVHTEAQRELSH